MEDNKGLGVIRIKPLGAGGGGGESSSQTGLSSIKYTDTFVSIDGKCFTYPKMVVDPNMDQESLFHEFMPTCIDGFLSGYNVNIIAYGQTGSGKAYTVFGPPGCMESAGKGEYGIDNHERYGLFPRTLLEIYHRLQELDTSDSSKVYVMTCNAVELSAMGNEDMFQKSGFISQSLKQSFRSVIGLSSRGVKP